MAIISIAPTVVAAAAVAALATAAAAADALLNTKTSACPLLFCWSGLVALAKSRAIKHWQATKMGASPICWSSTQLTVGPQKSTLALLQQPPREWD